MLGIFCGARQFGNQESRNRTCKSLPDSLSSKFRGASSPRVASISALAFTDPLIFANWSGGGAKVLIPISLGVVFFRTLIQ